MPYTNLTTAAEQVSSTIESWISKEMDKGLLGDVETFISTNMNDEEIITPSIWISYFKWEPYKSAPLSDRMRFIVPVEFDCMVYEEELKKGETDAMNLLSRTVASILKHFRKRQELFNFINVELDSIMPNGQIEIVNKREIVPVAGCVLNFIVEISWLECSALQDKKNVRINLKDVEGVIGETVTLEADVTDEQDNKVDKGTMIFEKDETKDTEG